MHKRILVLGAIALSAAPAAHARITHLFKDSVSTLSDGYTLIVGHAVGELNPRHPLNAIIQDIELAPLNAHGKVEYTTTFQLAIPPAGKGSGLMWHDVPNRGGRLLIGPERLDFDIGLSSGWQGDDSGNPTLVPTPANPTNGFGTRQNASSPQFPSLNEWVHVPTAHHRDGSTITGKVLARIINRSGPGSQLLFVQGNQFPYRPNDKLNDPGTLTTHVHETMDGKVTVGSVIPNADWRWAHCDATHPFPGTPSDTEICLRNGFDGNLLYQVVFTAKDPLVLGVGFAAFRDLESFFKFEKTDDFGNPNPVAGQVRWSISRGVSQSGNFLRGYLHLGFNQDEDRRQVSDGSWPIIAGRRIALNFRWAQPDGVLELYEAGSEGPQWWARYQDRVRHLPKRGILDRCRETRTCPKIIEHFGAAEIWELKLGIEWVGTDAKADIPIPANVRRYYIPSTTHGGTTTPASTNLFDFDPPPPSCPGNNWAPGRATLHANPIPHTQTVNAIRAHFRDWVMKGILPPDSLYPRLGKPAEDGEDGERDDDEDGDGARVEANLVPATIAAMGFPSGQIPGVPAGVPEKAAIGAEGETPFINPVLDYDWGPFFNPSDGSGVPTNFPPPIKQVIHMRVPRTDADGNELGGVPVVLRDAPLGSYFGWNITAANSPTANGFHKDQNCDYTGGWVPFAVSPDKRAANDHRLSLSERYGTHAGYVQAVQSAATRAVAMGFLLQADADALVAAADASHVLK